MRLRATGPAALGLGRTPEPVDATAVFRQIGYLRTLIFRGCGLHCQCMINLCRGSLMSSTYFGLLAEFGEANIPLDKVAPKYFGLSYEEARRRAPAKMLPCRVFRLGGQKSPWLISAADLAELIDRQRQKAG